MTYRYMRKVHAIGSHLVRPGDYSYKKSLCGQTMYCREIPEQPFHYGDQFGTVPLVSWRKPELVTCKSCQKAMSK